jgi:uncharacterized protein (TIGR04255 family)
MASQVWQQPPVVIVLIQVVFQPVINFVTIIQELQPTLKDLGWIGSNYLDQQVFESIFDGSGQLSSNTRTERVYQFCTVDQKEVLDIRDTSLTISIGNYVDFNESFRRFEMVLAKFRESIKDTLIQRVGLRYVDLFEATQSLPLTQQMNSLARETMEHETSNQQIIQLKPPDGCLLLLRVSQGEFLRQILHEFAPPIRTGVFTVSQKKIDTVLLDINTSDPFSMKYLCMDLDASKVFPLNNVSPLQMSNKEMLSSYFVELHKHCKKVFDEQISEIATKFYRDGS